MQISSTRRTGASRSLEYDAENDEHVPKCYSKLPSPSVRNRAGNGASKDPAGADNGCVQAKAPGVVEHIEICT